MTDAATNNEPELEPLELDSGAAERIVEKLRFGLPPEGFVRHFTVGRREELHKLEHDLMSGLPGRATLVRANYGAGKTHLLNLIRDLALANNYATSFITVSSQNGVRFNRMDQVFSAVCRAIECPGREDSGVMSLFRAYDDANIENLDPTIQADREELEDNGRWCEEGLLRSPAVYIALRAAIVSESDDTRDLVADWLTRGDPDKLPRIKVVETLVEDLRVGDPRSRGSLYRDISFRRDQYEPTWGGLNDLNTIAQLAGFRGLVLLFDEFEDVIQNLGNIRHERDAFGNLFRFFSGEYNCAAYFAVTPDFVRKAKDRLLQKSVWDFPYRRFDELPHFELSPIEFDDFRKLCAQILHVHAQAYEWHPAADLDWQQTGNFVIEHWNPGSPERIRMATKAFVDYLDDELDRVE